MVTGGGLAVSCRVRDPMRKLIPELNFKNIQILGFKIKNLFLYCFYYK